jgi:hypothetical protein
VPAPAYSTTTQDGSNLDARTSLPTYEKSVAPWMFLWGWLFFVAFKWYWLGSRAVYVFAV